MMRLVQTRPDEVLVVGEALVDIIPCAHGTEEHPGGSPANVALGLARLGAPTSFLTAIARDPRGEAIASRLGADNVRLLPESWSAVRTATAEAEIRADGSAAYSFDIEWALPENIELPAARHLHIGSISAFLHPGADRVQQIARTLREAGATVSLDPNIRPALTGDPEPAQMRFQRLAALAHLVKLSDEDAAFLYPDLAPTQAVRAIGLLGPVVALTRGQAGSLLYAGRDIIEVGPVPTAVSDTVGAGDSYMSALLWALLRRIGWPFEPGDDHELAAAGAFAAAAAAITVSRRGAQPPTLHEINKPVAVGPGPRSNVGGHGSSARQ
ncbi:carbohydrate kinase family protein [Sinomonas sp.]|jgi:fructokinase|uniref:carbohydrate kinase family protein n=1 Tax=Sinomonas sp. TaxID=1914986 RepID=UPI002FE09C59